MLPKYSHIQDLITLNKTLQNVAKKCEQHIPMLACNQCFLECFMFQHFSACHIYEPKCEFQFFRGHETCPSPHYCLESKILSVKNKSYNKDDYAGL